MKKYALAAMIAATMALAACGSSDKKDDTSGGDTTAASGGSNQALSYSDFVAQANKLCAGVNAKVAAAGTGLTGEAANDAPILDKLLPLLKDAAASLDTITPPDELADAWDTFEADVKSQIAEDDTALAAAKAGDDETYKAQLAKLQQLDAQTNTDAAATGAAECAK
jgi:hypothetical protein